MNNSNQYRTKVKKLTGTKYGEIYKKAFNIYSKIKKRSKRRAYVRSSYFSKSKIFISLFWQHLGDKHYRDRIRRLKYFPCAIELIRHSRFAPSSIENVDRKEEILHRFTGITPEKETFFVQIKETKRNGQKYLISIFPLEN